MGMDRMIKIAICDDENYYINIIKKLLAESASKLCVQYNLNVYTNVSDFEKDFLVDIHKVNFYIE